MLSWNNPQRQKELDTAKAIAALEETEGWQAFVRVAESLIKAMTPEVQRFTQEEATEIASQLAFASGIKRCIGLMQQQKDIINSSKDK